MYSQYMLLITGTDNYVGIKLKKKWRVSLGVRVNKYTALSEAFSHSRNCFARHYSPSPSNARWRKTAVPLVIYQHVAKIECFEF